MSNRFFKPPDEWRQHYAATGKPKLPWRSEAAAEAHARSFAEPMQAYQCSKCGRWHVGLRRNPLQWMHDDMMTVFELGDRAAAHLRHEGLSPRAAITARFRTAERVRKRDAVRSDA